MKQKITLRLENGSGVAEWREDAKSAAFHLSQRGVALHAEAVTASEGLARKMVRDANECYRLAALLRESANQTGPLLYVVLTPEAIELLCKAARQAVARPEDSDYDHLWSPNPVETKRVRRLAALLLEEGEEKG